jgi:hypothetical protein
LTITDLFVKSDLVTGIVKELLFVFFSFATLSKRCIILMFLSSRVYDTKHFPATVIVPIVHFFLVPSKTVDRGLTVMGQLQCFLQAF